MTQAIRPPTFRLTGVAAILLPTLLAAASAAAELEDLRLRGRLFTRYEVQDERAQVGRWTDTLSLTLVRFDARWEPTKDLRLGLELELRDGFALKDTYIRYDLHRALRITAGHFKKPISRLQLTSRWELVVPRRGLQDDLALSEGLFGGYGGRDVGLMISGRLVKAVKLRYFLGAFDGFELEDAFYHDVKEPAAPNTSHRDYVARLQLEPLAGLELAAAFCHKRAGVLLAPGNERIRSFNLAGGDLALRLGDFALELEGAWGDNPSAATGHKLLGGHAILSFRIQLGEQIALTPALMVEGQDADTRLADTEALRIAGALNLDLGRYVRLVLSAEGGAGKINYAVTEYLTPEQAETVQKTPRTVATRLLLQLQVSI